MPPARKPRWPFQPLMEAANAPSMKALGRRLNVDTRQLRWWKNDGLTDQMADRLALRLGLMPEQVWPSWFDIDITPLLAEEEAARAVAETKLERKRSRDREWAATYRQREAQRIAEYQRAYRSIEGVKEAKRRYSRSYYRRNRERLLEAQRRRDRLKREMTQA